MIWHIGSDLPQILQHLQHVQAFVVSYVLSIGYTLTILKQEDLPHKKNKACIPFV